MSTLHELARAHYERERGELLHVSAPELGEDSRIYFYRWPTGEEVTELLPLAAGADYHFVLKAFAVMARDEKGARLFTKTNEHEVGKQWHYPLVYRLVEEMGVADRIAELAETAKKN